MNTNTTSNLPTPEHQLDARGLHCPMPLLKLKVALRQVHPGETLRLIASDPASQQDITRYCQVAGLTCTSHPVQTGLNEFVFDIQKTV